MELGCRVGDGGDWHHDQIRVDTGLVPRGVLHDSAGVAVLCVEIRFCLILASFDVASFDQRLHYSSWADPLLVCVGFWNCHSGDNSVKFLTLNFEVCS